MVSSDRTHEGQLSFADEIALVGSKQSDIDHATTKLISQLEESFAGTAVYQTRQVASFDESQLVGTVFAENEARKYTNYKFWLSRRWYYREGK